MFFLFGITDVNGYVSIVWFKIRSLPFLFHQHIGLTVLLHSSGSPIVIILFGSPVFPFKSTYTYFFTTWPSQTCKLPDVCSSETCVWETCLYSLTYTHTCVQIYIRMVGWMGLCANRSMLRVCIVTFYLFAILSVFADSAFSSFNEGSEWRSN